MTATEGMDQFPEPKPLPRMYRLITPDHREEDANAWMKFGACNSADPEAFFPDKRRSRRTPSSLPETTRPLKSNACSTPSTTTSTSACGAACQNTRGANSAPKRHRRRAGAA